MRKIIFSIFCFCIFSCSDWFLTEIEQECEVENPQFTFDADIKPIFNENCVVCHDSDNPTYGPLNLSGYEHFNVSEFLIPGNPHEGKIIERIKNQDNPMPPNWYSEMLNQETIDTISTWIMECAVEN